MGMFQILCNVDKKMKGPGYVAEYLTLAWYATWILCDNKRTTPESFNLSPCFSLSITASITRTLKGTDRSKRGIEEY